eukprot:CAMPEP_0197629338 /NCGR_PEP_ID=MMETSP1338-20131121/7231_1 /TAXON_ID=43686 ORGANISM="Pelagodinium beii, Strain RCC1491" /NCGR_SAMPLE_ID=MMETSP1338 /ASSEMBLY_ACC=CAM_ASM_000754 /LENGTH=474 /DNA_ID=CAMNT_0043200369 /DNA_START=34 /DNA_END=1458 /DNA_ORIENTATION=-
MAVFRTGQFPPPSGMLPPFPDGPVAPPPWANHHAAMAALKHVQPRTVKVDGDLYAPGMNPTFHDPFIGIPRPILAAPKTPQYGGPWLGHYPQVMPTSSLRFGTWAQAQIRNILDVHETQTPADMVREIDYHAMSWFFVQLDGWILHFWAGERYDPMLAQMGRITPTASIDVRFVRRMETYSVDTGKIDAYLTWGKNRVCYYKVCLVLQTGIFAFWVRTHDEAQDWCRVINMLMGESGQIELRQKEIAAVAASDLHLRDGPAMRPGRPLPQMEVTHVVDPEKQKKLRRLWADCVKAAGRGETAPPQAFDAIYRLYDNNDDESLCLEEIMDMYKDLISVRKIELEKAMDRQSHTTMSDKSLLMDSVNEVNSAWGTVSTIGQGLLEDYRSKLSPQGFQSRALLLRSQLDTSADQRVSLAEFMDTAPVALLPMKELKVEAQFYELCSKAIKRARKAEIWARQGEDLDDEYQEGICVQQ